MKRVIFRRWTIAVDVEATTKAYAGIERGGAERCDCTPCKNFAMARERVYPAEVVRLFETLGIDRCREAERGAIGPAMIDSMPPFAIVGRLGDRRARYVNPAT